MSRLRPALPVVASVILLGAGCQKAKPVSEFVRNCDVPGTFSAIAKQTGVSQEGFNFTSTNNALDGKANWTANVRYCTAPTRSTRRCGSCTRSS